MKEWMALTIASGLGGRVRGAHLGIAALRVGTEAHYFFDKCAVSALSAHHAIADSPCVHARHVRAIYAVLRETSTKTAQLLQTMQSVSSLFAFSGDHSIAAGIMAGLRVAHPAQRVGMVWIDAHPDLQTPYTTRSGYMHGMAMAMALEEDNITQKINSVSAAEAKYWDNIKGLARSADPAVARLSGHDVVFIGVRDVESAEDLLMKRYRMPMLSVAAIRQKSAAWAVQETLAHLRHCDVLYVSFDVDSLDPSVSVGTGTPVAHGLSLAEAIAINRGLMASPKTKIWEMTEINPLLDTQNAMAQAGCQVLQAVEQAYSQR